MVVGALVKSGGAKVAGYIAKKIKKKLKKTATKKAQEYLEANKEEKETLEPKPKPKPTPFSSSGTKWGTDKGAVNMVKHGNIKEHGAQAGAYKPAEMGASKQMGWGSKSATYAQKKLLTEPRALTYSKAASMKTRR